MLDKIRSAGNFILGILFIIAIFALFGLCQFVKGEVRPFVPWPLRGLLFGGESDVAVIEYMEGVDTAFERFFGAAEECRLVGDQICLTRTVERLQQELGPTVPIQASWMSNAHARLYESVSRMAELNNRRSETQRPSNELESEAQEAILEIDAALIFWLEQAQR
ncbi:MAG: hypothetical protein IH861_14390 [Chloroflexi bacterium]|nr:hypothetical protein [Chloroflexota bacterium]